MMRGSTGTMWIVILLAMLVIALPARAIVIEDVVAHHPLVALVSSWGASTDESRTDSTVALNTDSSLLSPELRDLPAATETAVSVDNMTVDVVPIRFPKLPASVVFTLYLIGALVFYTLLILVAQPGPSEYY